ncbi:MAG: hypothetical protein Q9226_008609 [Calogaya cf. arnoldii]
MANPGPLQHAVDSLEPTLALVLKETGKFFRATQSNDPKHIAIARTALSHTIPSANVKFHDALDDLETEIVSQILYYCHAMSLIVWEIRAKSVFERDLSTIRAKRAERERAAAGMLKTQRSSGIVKIASLKGSPKVKPAAAPEPERQDPPQEPLATMRGGDLQEKPDPANPEPVAFATTVPPTTEMTSETVKAEPFTIPESLPQDPTEPKGLAISLDQDPSTSAPADPPKMEPGTTTASNESSLQVDAMPPGLSSLDFESMFEDSELPGPSDAINFDLAFPKDNTDDPAGLLDVSAFANLPISNTETTDNANLGSADEDLTTLLPGLENYVNDNNDFQLPDMPGSNLFDSDNNGHSLKPDEQNPSGMKQGEGGGNRQEMPRFNAPMIESSFEDLFGLDSYMHGTGEEELGGTGQFDDAWFNTDGM